MWGKCIQYFIVPEESRSWNFYTSAMLINYIDQTWPDLEVVVQGMDTSMDKLFLALHEWCLLVEGPGQVWWGRCIYFCYSKAHPYLSIWGYWSDHLSLMIWSFHALPTQRAGSVASEWLTWRALPLPCKFIWNVTARKHV